MGSKNCVEGEGRFHCSNFKIVKIGGAITGEDRKKEASHPGTPKIIKKFFFLGKKKARTGLSVSCN